MKTKASEKTKNTKSQTIKTNPLASWTDNETKERILHFINRTTDGASDDYIEPEDRIAVFDNDGTLWAEYPMYTQFQFLIDRIKALVPQHPEWKEEEPYKAIIEGDIKSALAGGLQDIEKLLMITHAGMSSEEFSQIVIDWISTAKHPYFNKLYTECIYHPMLELISYFKSKQFKVYIVSGGGVEFMRPWVEETYGIPPERVIGSSIKTKYEVKNGVSILSRLPEINFVDDKEGKPVGIYQQIGKRPIVAIGNSDGDFQMLEWVTSGKRLSLGILVHHDDSEREYAYDAHTFAGKLVQGLREAKQRDWLIVSMKKDWKRVF